MLPSTRSVRPQVEEEPLSSYVLHELDIRYRNCTKFSATSNDEKTCVCGKPKDLHTSETKAKWDMKINTKEIRNAPHGRLINGASFALLKIDTEFEKVEKLLLKVWNIPEPKLIMSIIGGGKYFSLNERLQTNFINGIVEVASKSNVWIVASGCNVGVTQLVGQAINKVRIRRQKYDMTAICICKWGDIKDVEMITQFKKEETTLRNTRQSNTTIDEDEEKEFQSGGRDLEMNYSHYLMLDDGRYRHYATGEFRTDLCTRMAKLENKNTHHVPVVTIVVEGGVNIVANTYYDLRKNIPVVIIDGSGRVADLFSRWLLYTREFNNKSEHQQIVYEIEELRDVTPLSQSRLLARSKNRTNIHVELHVDQHTKQLHYLFRKFKSQLEKDLKYTLYRDDQATNVKPPDSDDTSNVRNEKQERTLNQILYCLQPAVRSNITVFNLNSENKLSDTIFGSICESYEKISKRKKAEANDLQDDHAQINRKNQNVDRTELLRLAMDWDCIDVAKDYVLQNSFDFISDKSGAFKTALVDNLPTFVYEYLKLGIDPSDIFFPEKTFTRGLDRYKDFIELLYNEKIYEDADAKTHLKSFVESNSKLSDKGINSTDALNILLRSLIGDYIHKLYFNTLEEEQDDRIKCGLMKEPKLEEQVKLNATKYKKTLSDEEQNELARDYIMRDLFLWAVLMNRTDMAKVFLAHMKYRICPALIATKVFKRYYERASYGDIKDGYQKSAEYFEKYAIDCLDKCDDYDAAKACEIILQQNELYGYVTCLQVAADARDKLFIATSCSVEAMNNIWYDKLHAEQTRKRDILALVLGFITFGLLAPLAVTYREDETDMMSETPKQILEPYGINYCDPYALEHPRYFKSVLAVNRYIHRVKNFHSSLLMKYCYHFITYCFFLLLFSYVLLFDFAPPTNHIPSIHWTEILTIILVSCMLIEEIHYFLDQDNLTFIGKSKNCFRDFFKPMTLVAFMLFYIGLIVRFTYANSEEEFVAARIIMAIDVELWWLRFLSYIIVIPFLGPHLVAIGKMLKDLLFFMCIIVIVMAGYGVASRSMVYYPRVNNFTTETGGSIDASFGGRSVFRQIAYPVYYLLYGQIDNELDSLEANQDAGWSIATQVLLAIHMLFVNILLVNLLIAMFSKRFDEVYEDTKNIWHSQQYLFTREYYTRSPFIPPFSLIFDVYSLYRMLVRFVKSTVMGKRVYSEVTVFKIIPKKRSLRKELYGLEGASTYNFAHVEAKASKVAPTKESSESDSNSAGKEKDGVDDPDDSDNTLDNLKQVQDQVVKLSSTIKGMKEKFNEYLSNNGRIETQSS